MSTSAPPSAERLAPVNTAAGIVGGIVEVADFFLPLWAGERLHLGGTAIGLLLAVDLLVAAVLRPWVGHVADRLPRPLLAAIGAAFLAVSMTTFSFATSLPAALVAAALSGVGGAFFRVPVLALTGETRDDGTAFAGLTGAEGTGTWVAYVVAFSVLSAADYEGVFLACAGAAAVAALCVSRARSTARPVTDEARPKVGRLAPFLVLVGATALVEAGAGLLVILRLQQDLGLSLEAIVVVFVPGLIAYSIFPEAGPYLRRCFGTVAALRMSLALSAIAVAGLILAPDATWITVAWVALCISWALAQPLESLVVSRLSGDRLGRGLGRYEAAQLLGGAAGTALIGWSVEGLPPAGRVALCGGILAACAASVHRALPGEVASHLDADASETDGAGESELGGCPDAGTRRS